MRSPRRQTMLAAAVAPLLFVLPACGGGGDSASPAAAPNTVILKDIAFKPAQLTVKVGDTVTWIWNDGVTQHDVSFADKSIASSNGFQSKGQFQATFPTAGTFSYRCLIHPGMDGTITVVANPG